MRKLPCLVLLACGTFMPLVGAQWVPRENIGQAWSLRIDNDAFALAASDRSYTMGVHYLHSTRSRDRQTLIDRNPLFVPLRALKHWLHPRTPAVSAPTVVERSFLLQGETFTPACLYSAGTCKMYGAPIAVDRPYASLFWVGARESLIEAHGAQQTSEFNLGIFGTNISNVVQTWIHERCCSDRLPQEWRTQIGDGGSLSFLHRSQWRHPLLQSPVSGNGLDANYGYQWGWNTWPMAGLAGRLGAFSLDLELAWVLYNQSLQGAWGGSNAVTYAYSQLEPLVATAQLSIDVLRLFGAATAPNWGIQLSQSWRTRELKSDGGEDLHRWGSLQYWARF